MIDKIRKRNEDLLKKYSKNSDDYKRLEIISYLVSDELCFFKIDMENAINILLDLEYSENEAFNIYKELISAKEYFKYVEELQ